MKGFVLSKEQLNELKAAHRKAKRSNAHAAYKINAVILLGTGWTLKQVKQALLLDEEKLRSYLNKYRQDGIEGLIRTHYMGRSSVLTEPQENQLREELDRTIHLNTSSIIDYVSQHFERDYTPSGMRDLLHRMGYEYKKPKCVPGAIRIWMPKRILSNSMRPSWRKSLRISRFYSSMPATLNIMHKPPTDG